MKINIININQQEMAKIYHDHVARVMQSALTLFRKYNAGETVSSICDDSGVNCSRAEFYLV